MILLNYGDKKIKGDSETAGFEEEVQLSSVKWGVGRAVTSKPGSSDRKFGDPAFSEISVSKKMDMASIDLFIEAAGGKKPTTAVLSWVESDSEGDPQVYHQIELENAVISSYSSSAEGDMPKENFTLNFVTINVLFTHYPSEGDPKPISPKGWNLKTNTKL